MTLTDAIHGGEVREDADNAVGDVILTPLRHPPRFAARASMSSSTEPTGTFILVLHHPNAGPVADLPMRFRSEHVTNHQVRTEATDASGLVKVDLEVNRETHTYVLNLTTGPLAKRSLGLTLPALRLLRRMHRPFELGVSVPGRTPEQTNPLENSEPPLDEDYLQLLEALHRVAQAAGVPDLAIPGEFNVGTARAIEKADRLVAGEVVAHTWTELTLYAKASAVTHLLEDVFPSEFGLEVTVPFDFEVGGTRILLERRSLRVFAATVVGRDEALRHANNDDSSVAIQLAPGRTNDAESQLGEFPESIQTAVGEGGRRLYFAKAGRSGRSDLSRNFDEFLWGKADDL